MRVAVMGQALRRVTGRARSSSIEPPSSSSSSPSTIKIIKKTTQSQQEFKTPKSFEFRTPNTVSKKRDEDRVGDPGSDNALGSNTDTVLEERDRGYDAMLSQMVGRIKSKPGGKLEMGEASVVERYNRPMPKLRNTTPESVSYEERPVPPGTLNVSQLRQILLIHKGMTEAANVHQIAEKFRVDAMQVEKIVQFLSLPQEEETSSKQKD